MAKIKLGGWRCFIHKKSLLLEVPLKDGKVHRRYTPISGMVKMLQGKMQVVFFHTPPAPQKGEIVG